MSFEQTFALPDEDDPIIAQYCLDCGKGIAAGVDCYKDTDGNYHCTDCMEHTETNKTKHCRICKDKIRDGQDCFIADGNYYCEDCITPTEAEPEWED